MRKLTFIIFLLSVTYIVSCKKIDTDSCPNCPQVLSLFPNAAQYDDTVLIIGKNLMPDPDFNDKLEVKFNGILIPDNYIIDYDDEAILLIIPKSTQSGPVTVDLNIGDELIGKISADFTYLQKFTLSTYAGTPGGNGDNIDNINPLLAYFREPKKIAVDEISGDLYVVCKLDQNDPDGVKVIRKIEFGGGVTSLKKINSDISAIACKNAEVYFSHPNSYDVISKLDYNGAQWNIKDIVGSQNSGTDTARDGDFQIAKFKQIKSMAFDKDGNLFVIDEKFIRKISFSGNSGNVATIAGSKTQGFVDNVIPINATFNNPSSLTIENNGTIFISDRGNQRIRKFTPNLVSTIAGTGTAGGDSTEVSASSAKLRSPAAIVADNYGNLFFHESNIISNNGRPYIRKLNIPSNMLSVYAGAWTSTGFSNNWDHAFSARFNMDSESGLAYDNKRKILYMADTYNHVIRKISSE